MAGSLATRCRNAARTLEAVLRSEQPAVAVIQPAAFIELTDRLRTARSAVCCRGFAAQPDLGGMKEDETDPGKPRDSPDFDVAPDEGTTADRVAKRVSSTAEMVTKGVAAVTNKVKETVTGSNIAKEDMGPVGKVWKRDPEHISEAARDSKAMHDRPTEERYPSMSDAADMTATKKTDRTVQDDKEASGDATKAAPWSQ